MLDFGKVTFKDGNEIVLEDIYPGTYETKTFTIEKTGSNSSGMRVSYIIELFVGLNTLTVAANGEFVYSVDGSTNGDGTLVSADNAIVPQTTSQLGNEGNILDGETHEYIFTIGINETGSNQNSIRGKSFNGYLQVVNESEYSHGDL